MGKVYLHKEDNESKVFDTETAAYEAAKKDGWSEDRTPGADYNPPKETENVIAAAPAAVKAIDLSTVDTQDLFVECKKRGMFPNPEDIAAKLNEGNEDLPGNEDPVKLTDLRKPELQAIATELGIGFVDKTTIAQLIELILAKEGEEDA